MMVDGECVHEAPPSVGESVISRRENRPVESSKFIVGGACESAVTNSSLSVKESVTIP